MPRSVVHASLLLADSKSPKLVACKQMTEAEISDLLHKPGKQVLRAFEWSRQEGAKDCPWQIFDSSVQIGAEMPYSLRFIAKYRPAQTLRKGEAVVSLPEKINVGLVYSGHRIAAYDTVPGQRHTNKVGVGRPYYQQTITAITHRHIWVGKDGYVEPIDPPMLDVVQLIHAFADEYNLVMTGSVHHPLVGQQGTLI